MVNEVMVTFNKCTAEHVMMIFKPTVAGAMLHAIFDLSLFFDRTIKVLMNI
jgi:hypothetical protein